MKKLILALGFVLGMGSLTATQAQMRIYSPNLVKFGSTSVTPTLSSGLEVVMPNFLFKGSSAKFTIDGKTLEIKGGSDFVVGPTSTGDTPNGIVGGGGGAITMNNTLKLMGPHNEWEIGSTSSRLKTIYVTTCNSISQTKTSDSRYKTNIQDLAPALDKIMRLRPVTFDYLDGKNGQPLNEPFAVNQAGLIAQELDEVIPEAVLYMEDNDIYTVDYTTLIPFLIKTIQEQQVQIAEQQSLLESQQLQIEDLQMAMASENAALSTPAFNSVKPDNDPAGPLEASGNRLWSNVPNPFKQETRIRYALTDEVREAQLCIYDLSGRQLSCHRLNDRGQSEFVLRAASLNPGIYLYSLIADGQVVDTHRMAVTE